MAAPSNAVPAVGKGPSATDAEVGVLTYVHEVSAGAATLLQEVPIVGSVCRTFLSLEQLVETANSNKEELAVLCKLCDVVIKGVLTRRWGSLGKPVEKGLEKLKTHVDKAEAVAPLCNEVGIGKKGVKQFMLHRKIRKEIAAVRKNVLDFSTTNNLVLTKDLHVSASSAVFWRLG